MAGPDQNSETGSEGPRKFSRREFLKMAGTAGAAVALRGVKPETGKPNDDILSIETPEARYFPIYESHPQPASREQLELLPPQDIFFYEFPRDARYFVNQPPQAILDSSFPLPVNDITSPDSVRNYYVPRDHLEWLRANNTKICFEGYYGLPGGSTLNAISIMVAETIISASAGFQLLLHAKPKENRGKGMDRKQFLKLAAGLAAVWGLSSTTGLMLPFSRKTEVKTGALERTMIKAQGLLSQAHPENPIIFFRNIMFARKLQFLGEVESKEKGRKARIAYNVGKAHAGIEDFLLIGKDWTLNFLNIASDQFLKRVIDANGDLDNFCSNVLFDPNAQNPTKTVLIDQELKRFLNKKLDISS